MRSSRSRTWGFYLFEIGERRGGLQSNVRWYEEKEDEKRDFNGFRTFLLGFRQINNHLRFFL